MQQFGVIGLGSIGQRHLRNLRSLFPDAALYSVSASGKTHSTAPAQASAISLEQLIALKPDFVVVASPASLHLQHTQCLLEAGIAVLVEKPLCATEDEAAKLLQLIEQYPNAIIDVAYCLRFLPAAQQVKQVIDSGQLGRIYSVIAQVGQYLPHWRPDSDYRQSVSAQAALGGGALLELSHELDYLQWFFGPLQLRYACNRQSGLLQLDVEDISELLLESADRTSCFVHLDFIQQAPSRHCSLIGAKGRIDWDFINNSVTLRLHNQQHLLYQDDSYDKNGMYITMLQAFWHKVQQHDNSKTNVSTAAAIVRLIAQAKHSASEIL